MKNIKNIFYAGMLALCTMSLASCGDDDETYDFPGDAYNRVYLLNNSSSYKIVQTPISSVSNLDFKTSLKCTRKASANIRATVEIDNSMIAAYNEENETNYEAMPAAALKLENAVMNIPAGAMAAIDTLCITLSEDQNVISTLRSENGYLIPLRITTTEGGASQPSTNVYSTYFTVTVTEDNVNHEAVESDITGTLIAESERVNWMATTDLSVSSWDEPISYLFTDNTSSSCYISDWNASRMTLDINMGKKYSYDGIKLQGHSRYTPNPLRSGTEIYTSDDGISWKGVGELGKNASFVAFYAPITSQYIRMVIPLNNADLVIFNIYAK